MIFKKYDEYIIKFIVKDLLVTEVEGYKVELKIPN